MCLLMVPVCGSPYLMYALLLGVLSLLSRSVAIGLLPAHASFVLVSCLVCVKRLTVLNCMPFVLLCIMRLWGASGLKYTVTALVSLINIFLLTRGQVGLKQNTGSADLWQWLLSSLDRLGQNNVQLIKTPAHRRVSSATTQREAWQFWNNSVADQVAKFANLDRGEEFWTTWSEHAQAVTAAKQLHEQAWQLHLQVGLLSVQDSASADLDVEVVHVPRPSRVFEPRFCIAAWKGSIPPAFANEYGYGMASRIARWWTARTSAGTEEIKWVSFVHLYVDYQLTWGCAGPLQSKKTWLDIFPEALLGCRQIPFPKKSQMVQTLPQAVLEPKPASHRHGAMPMCQ